MLGSRASKKVWQGFIHSQSGGPPRSWPWPCPQLARWRSRCRFPLPAVKRSLTTSPGQFFQPGRWWRRWRAVGFNRRTILWSRPPPTPRGLFPCSTRCKTYRILSSTLERFARSAFPRPLTRDGGTRLPTLSLTLPVTSPCSTSAIWTNPRTLSRARLTPSPPALKMLSQRSITSAPSR